jgi:adenosylhomocysteine nucleosidase
MFRINLKQDFFRQYCRKIFTGLFPARASVGGRDGKRLGCVMVSAKKGVIFACCAFWLGQAAALADEIGVLYALEADWRSLKGDATASAHTINGTVVQTVRIGPHTVRGVQMGAGNVETAINASRLLGRFPCDWVVSLGPAGRLRDDLPHGAVCIVNEVVAYQRGTWSGPGWSLATAARIPAPVPAAAPLPSSPWRKAVVLALASGDAFVANRGERERIRAETGADLVDMNSYGAALACQKSNVPLLLLKYPSDAADDAAADDFRKFIAGYGGSHGGALGEWIKALPASPDSPQAYDNIKRILE